MNYGLCHPMLLDCISPSTPTRQGTYGHRLLGVRGVLAYGEVGSEQTYSQQIQTWALAQGAPSTTYTLEFSKINVYIFLKS